MLQTYNVTGRFQLNMPASSAGAANTVASAMATTLNGATSPAALARIFAAESMSMLGVTSVGPATASSCTTAVCGAAAAATALSAIVGAVLLAAAL